jgi:hypothetical protein
MKKNFRYSMISALSFLGFILLTLLSCSGDPSSTQERTVIVQHHIGDIPDSVDHMHYAAIDDHDNRSYLSTEFPVSDAHLLEGILGHNTNAIVTEFHSENEEELGEDVQPIFFSDSAYSISVRYSRTDFISKRLAIVDMDAKTGNILVRGNLPLVKKGLNACYHGQDRCFAYDEINIKMKERMQQIDPHFNFNIEEYDVIEFVLHDNVGNKDELSVEMNTLGLNLDAIVNGYGYKWPPYDDGGDWQPKTIYTSTLPENKLWGLTWWPVYACDTKPCDEIDTDRGLNKYHFLDASAYLKELLTTPASSGKKRLIYFHCIQGADRTGTLHIAYIMDNNPTLSFADAIDRAWKGKREGSDYPQLDYTQDDVKPMCTYVGLAYRYCLEKNRANPAQCDMPGGFGKDATLCKPSN